MNPRRNDPCPCGSGTIYKKCCARTGATFPETTPRPRDDRDIARRAALRRGVSAALARYASRPGLRAARFAAFDALVLDPLDETNADLETKVTCYLFFDHDTGNGRSIAELFLDGHAWMLGAQELALLRRLTAARLRLYEVEEIALDEGLHLHDLWSGERVFVTERSATHQLQRWDLLAARVAPDEIVGLGLEGGIYVFPVAARADLLKALRKAQEKLRRGDPGLTEDVFFRRAAAVIHRFWTKRVAEAVPPSLVTAEGDPVALGRVTYAVVDEARLRTALDAHPQLLREDDGWSWVEEVPGFTRALAHIAIDEDRLVVEVASQPRAERARRLVEDAAGDAVRHRSTVFEGVVPAREGHRAQRPRNEVVAPPEAEALVRQFKEQHYRGWIDHPLPALDGRTPRHAARLKTLRPRLETLLKEMENREARGPEPHYDFGWMWAELGLRPEGGTE